MSEYERLLEEVRAKVDFYRRKNAREYVPSMFRALCEENTNLTSGGARAQLEKDCSDIWQKRTILEFLPDEAKDAKRQESGRLGQKKRRFAAVSAAPYRKKEEIAIDTEGKPMTTFNSTNCDHQGLAQSNTQNKLRDIEFTIDVGDIWQHLLFREFNKDIFVEGNVRFKVKVDERTFQVIYACIVETPTDGDVQPSWPSSADHTSNDSDNNHHRHHPRQYLEKTKPGVSITD